MIQKNKIYIFITALLTVGVSAKVSAQQMYDFQTIMRLGLAHSHVVKMNQSDSMIHALEIQKARMNFIPGLSVSGQSMMLNQPEIVLNGKKAGLAPPKSASFAMGSLSLPVFSGFQMQNNLDISKEMALAGIEKSRADSVAVAMQIVDAYLSVYKAQKSLVIIDESIRSAEQRVTDFGKLLENDLITPNDFLKAKLQLSNLKYSLVQIGAQNDLANYQLALLTGLDPEKPITIDTSVFLQIPEIVSQSEFSRILMNRNDYKAMEHQAKASEYVVKMQKSHYYPVVSLTGMYASVYVPNMLTIGNVLNGGVKVSMDLSSLYKNGNSVEIKTMELARINEQMEQLSEKIMLESYKGFLDFQTAGSKQGLSREMLEQSSENYREVKGKYDNQLATVSDVLEAETENLQAKINYQVAQSDKFMAYFNYLKVSGNFNQIKSIK